jgi:hypothetical protein
MPRQLMVIDGADRGQSFLLPDAGTVRIGNSRKNTDICLHDLFVARVHCHVDVAEGKVTVSDETKPNGILVNGAKVAQQELQPGDVVRVGNSYLRLEEADASALTDTKINGPANEPGKLPHLPRERLGALTGHYLGHYDIGIALAHGHYGVVFRSRHDKTEQSAAIKVFPAGFPASDDEMQRFIRAMKPRMAVQHAGLVPLRGVGKSGPYVWLAMELVEGDSAATIIRRWQTAGKFKWRAALRIAAGEGPRPDAPAPPRAREHHARERAAARRRYARAAQRPGLVGCRRRQRVTGANAGEEVFGGTTLPVPRARRPGSARGRFVGPVQRRGGDLRPPDRPSAVRGRDD